MNKLTAAEIRALKKLNTPDKIQNFLSNIKYHLEDTVYSPRKVLRHRTAHCFEGAMFAAAALRINGYEPLIMDMEADETDTDHVIAIYRENGAWGAIGISNYPGCRGRPAIYKTLRELTLSYFMDYFNDNRQLTLRRYSRPVNLKRFDKRNWMTAEEDLWFIEEYLFEIPHRNLISKKMEKSLVRLDERSYRAGTFGRRKKKTKKKS